MGEIKQYYIQDGKKIEHQNSETAEWCSSQKQKFGDRDSFTEKGGMKAIGEALDRGMVLVISMWDDIAFQMNWLDSYDPKAPDPSAPVATPSPSPSPSGCPGGSLDACIDLCPADVFAQCVESCKRRCEGVLV